MSKALLLGLLFTLVGCAGPGTREAEVAPALSGSQHLQSDRMAFGQSIPGGGMVTTAEWDRFMREVVTPHFPAGLTIWRAEGQWAGPQGTVREPVKIVEVIHPKGRPTDAVFEKIAAEYCRRFRQDAVLRTASPTRSWLYDSQK